MPTEILWSGRGGENFLDVLRTQISTTKPTALGLAVAYASVYGVRELHGVLRRNSVSECRVVTDIRDCVTHPNALRLALDSGWDVRVVNSSATFHSKLYVGCKSFGRGNEPRDHKFSIVGSPNLSKAAFQRNAECFFVSDEASQPASTGATWAALWQLGTRATPAGIKRYEKLFQSRNRWRPVQDLVTLGVAEDPVSGVGGLASPLGEPALSPLSATAAWAGLESFTGDYKLQPEFPSRAANVLRNILSSRAAARKVDMLCEDGITREFTFPFYKANGMFRLNVPNDVPSAQWARANKAGIALVEVRGVNDIRFTIVRPGRDLNEVVKRSRALGTLGSTSTRLYGWY
ncbi:MAG: PLD-like protein [Alphaproteobacteria bacterium]|nr:PLD-like protein [Alphaproteobacteria bacterium]